MKLVFCQHLNKTDLIDWIFRFSDNCFGSCRVHCFPTLSSLRHTSKFAGSHSSQGKKMLNHLSLVSSPSTAMRVSMCLGVNRASPHGWSSLLFPTTFSFYFFVSTQAVLGNARLRPGSYCRSSSVSKVWLGNSGIETASFQHWVISPRDPKEIQMHFSHTIARCKNKTYKSCFESHSEDVNYVLKS